MNIRLLIYILIFALSGCAKEANPNVSRQKELAGILKPFLKPAIETDDYQVNSGWYDPTNRQTLRNFVEKYPDTEEPIKRKSG